MLKKNSFPNLEALLPEIREASACYHKRWEQALAAPLRECEALLSTAVTTYNPVLERAAVAFAEDTREVNHPSTLRMVWAPRRDFDLWFSQSVHDPLPLLEKWVRTGSISERAAA